MKPDGGADSPSAPQFADAFAVRLNAMLRTATDMQIVMKTKPPDERWSELGGLLAKHPEHEQSVMFACMQISATGASFRITAGEVSGEGFESADAAEVLANMVHIKTEEGSIIGALQHDKVSEAVAALKKPKR